jgi:hypothetical protein
MRFVVVLMRLLNRTTWAAIAAGVITFCAAFAVAADEGPYEPMGAPADPKVPARWNLYHDYAQATQLMQAMVAARPKLARLESLGQSYGGRQMWLLAVSNPATGDACTKPAFWIDGGIHANEIQGTEVALYTAWYLLEMYGRNPFITRLVDERTFYFVAMMSPDSRDAHMYRPNSTHSPRSGQRPVDDDRDGLVDEDGPDDLDADGNITQMRVRDPNGRWKPHPDYPNLMIEAADDEPGEFRLLGSEGFDNDGDGRVNEDGDGYYDPNRDWPFGWQPEYVQRGAYRYPLSIAENRTVADFILDHPNIAGAQSYHNTGGMILRGPGDAKDRYEPADVAVYDAVAKKGQMMLPAYRYLSLGEELYQVHGGQLDWLYSMRGIFTFSNELFTRENYFRRPPEGPQGRQEDMEAFNKYLLFGQGVVAWHEVEHPQYGRIEVGGFAKEWTRQPPSFLLEEECHRNMAFTLYHADQMPQVAVQSIEVKPSSGGLVEVTAVVANCKMTPTHAAVDRKHRITPPDVVAIEGKQVEVVAGLGSSDPLFGEAREQKHDPAEVRVDNVPGMGAVYVRWLVRGSGPFAVTVRSIKGGAARREGRL